ncbi:MAG: 23S rRNA (uracil(1939)-C(5))-methyltransferase RlmD [Ignavibacteriae bacterium]|nr:23S rRNA (uracil(1939)-C(5))-methyltransferase RlmD [Ignavibacteriota bacterium]
MQPHELTKGTELQLHIADSAFEGKTVSRIDGFVVFVEGAVPGDVVIARVTKVKKSYAEARVVRVEQPSSHRVEPRCKYFGTCGGCKWQHVGYEIQLRFKQQHVVDAFERIGGFADLPILPIIGSEDIYFYRNKMEYSFSDQQWLSEPPVRNSEIRNPKPEIFVGLHVPQRYDKVLDITECHLQSETSNRILNVTREFARKSGLNVYTSESESGYFRFLVIRQSKRTNELMVNLVTFDEKKDVMQGYVKALQTAAPEVTTVVNTINTKKAQIAYGETEQTYLGDGVIHERLGKHLFTVSASSFFQTNTVQAERLYGVAKSFAELQPHEVVWDLYSGTGSIALLISAAAKEVIGIESVESAVRDAKRNADANGVTNCRFILGDLKDRLTRDTAWMQSHAKPDVMVIDPPRSGMHQRVVEEILALNPTRIVYVSCNPTTQARDVKILCSERYRLVKLQPVDMFPHTYHIESVALLHRV